MAHSCRCVALKRFAYCSKDWWSTVRRTNGEPSLRDAASASDELRTLLARGREQWGASAPGGVGALLFTCGGRGTNLFRALDHDARALREHLGEELPVAGFFANGEIGPVGGRPFLHGFTASVAFLTAAD